MVSFIIISGGQRPKSIRRLLSSIVSQNIPEYQIVIVGKHDGALPDGALYIKTPDLAESGAICKMRNIGIKASKGDPVVLLDDDVEFSDGWYGKIKRRLDGEFDIASCAVLTPTGERWYDWAWASREDLNCPTRKADYAETGGNMYIGGCFMMIRRHVFNKVKFNENLMNRQRDDIEFCHRAWDAGFSLSIFPEAHVTHHLDPAGRSEDDPASGSDKFTEGIYSFRMGRFSEALKVFSSLKEGEAVRSRYYYALCLIKLNRKEEAVEELKYVIKIANVNDIEERRLLHTACFHIGSCMEEKGLNKEASEYYIKTLDGYKEHLEAGKGLDRVRSSVRWGGARFLALAQFAACVYEYNSF